MKDIRLIYTDLKIRIGHLQTDVNWCCRYGCRDEYIQALPELKAQVAGICDNIENLEKELYGTGVTE